MESSKAGTLKAPIMFVLQPNPTFKETIAIPVPGGEPGKITFEFKRLGKKALRTLFKSLTEGEDEREDADVLSEIIVGWAGVDEKFSKAALETLCDAYPGAATAVILGYNKAMLEGKAKN